MPYGQFQGEKIRKSIACALAVFYSSKEPFSLKKRFHYWFCRLFVVFWTNPVSCFEGDWEGSNALCNFWLALFLKINYNLADDSSSKLFYYWRTCKQQLTQSNKLVLQKEKLKLTLSATNISIPIFSSPAQRCSIVSWCRLQEFSSPWWWSDY